MSKFINIVTSAGRKFRNGLVLSIAELLCIGRCDIFGKNDFKYSTDEWLYKKQLCKESKWKIVAMIQDRVSAIINVSHTVHILSSDCRANSEKPHATGNTKRNCLNMEIIKDSNPPSRAWKIPWYAMFIPAKIKLREMILIALMQRACVSPDNPNNAEKGTAKISMAAKPITIIMMV